MTATFAKPGVYPYYCFVHNGMVGAIVVEDPAAASTSSRAPAQSGAPGATAVAAPAAGSGLASGDGWPNLTFVLAGLVAVIAGPAVALIAVRKRRTHTPV